MGTTSKKSNWIPPAAFGQRDGNSGNSEFFWEFWAFYWEFCKGNQTKRMECGFLGLQSDRSPIFFMISCDGQTNPRLFNDFREIERVDRKLGHKIFRSSWKYPVPRNTTQCQAISIQLSCGHITHTRPHVNKNPWICASLKSDFHTYEKQQTRSDCALLPNLWKVSIT